MPVRPPRPSRPVLVAGGAAVLVALLVAAGLAWQASRETALSRAVEIAPADTQRISWVDWAGVRRQLGADVDARSTPGQVEEFLDEAFSSDLTSTSALTSSAPVLQEELGFSPATIAWEMFAQGEEGAVVAMGMGEGLDVDALTGRLADLGFREPEEDADSGGTWLGGPDVLARIGPGLTPELQHLAVLADEGVVLASDRSSYLERAVDVARGDAARLESVDDVVDHSGEALAASVYTGPYTCEELAMAQADTTEQEQGELLVDQAGEVNPLTGFAMSAQPDGTVRVAMSLETEEQARENAESRAALASGPAPGQGGEFSDRFTVEAAGAEGTVVLLDLEPVQGEYVLSDLGSGPVLFATC